MTAVIDPHSLPPMKVTIEVEHPDGTIRRTTYHRAIDIDVEINYPPRPFIRSAVADNRGVPIVVWRFAALSREDGENSRHEIIDPSKLCDVAFMAEPDSITCSKRAGHAGRHRSSDDVGRIWWDT